MKKNTLSVFHLNSGSCNGCDIEALAAIRCAYPAACFTKQVSEKEKPDVIILSGILTKKAEKITEEVIQKNPQAKIIYIGSCALSGGVFAGSYNQAGPPDKLIAPSLYVAGCPPKPEAILEAIKKATQKKTETTKTSPPSTFRGKVTYSPSLCIKCLRCVQSCPASALRFSKEKNKLYFEYFENRCIFCGVCEEVCPQKAIKLDKNYQDIENKKEKFLYRWLKEEL